MTAPSSDYGAWSAWLDAFARGDDLPAGALAPVDDRLGPHVQERVVRRIQEAFEARQALWLATFQRRLSVTSPSDQVTELASAMIAARRRALPLRTLARSPLLPDDVRTALTDALTTMLRSTQQSIADSLRHARPEVQAAVRDNSLLRALTVEVAAPPPTPPARSGRRVIL